MSTDPQSAQEPGTREAPDNWWWLVARTPSGVHLYELGAEPYDVTPDDVRPLLGFPGDWELQPGWDLAIAPGRTGPEKTGLIEPREYGPSGEPLPMRAKPGVTLHLKDKQ